MEIAIRFSMPVRILVFQCRFLLEKGRFLDNLATIFTRSAIGLSLLGFFSCILIPYTLFWRKRVALSRPFML